jgi:hypothetical protein
MRPDATVSGGDTGPYYQLATADRARQWPVEEI